MPNERVRYFKPPEEIKERIVYVKDKDLLGFDSAASRVFQFHLWKMKKFGMSENFIMMDDDYFIGRPLNKSNFFYEENGQVYPGLVTRDFYEISKKSLHKILDPLLKNIKNTHPHSPNGFTIVQKTSLLFLYDIFGTDSVRHGNPLIEPSFTHNALPVKQSDIKEIYDYIEQLYPYKDKCLLAKERDIYALQPQTLFLAYPREKYDRRVKMISSTFFDLTQFKGIVKTELFVINVSNKNYAKSYFKNEINHLEKLYPEKTPYELDEKDIPKIENRKDEDKKNDEKEKKDNIKKDDKNDSYKTLMDYFEKQLLDKKQLKNDILKINTKLNELNEKYDNMGKRLEDLTIKYNATVKKNKTLIEYDKIETSLSIRTKLFFLLIIILILLGFLYYLIKNNYFSGDTINNNEVNYLDINSLGSSRNENEMSLMNSKIEI
jgi:hypothetical protein